MKKLIFALIIIGSALTVNAKENLPADFSRANDLYAKEQYGQAIALYDGLLEQSGPDAAVYFNLGNSYYKTQKYGKAMLSFERALRLKPRDSDIRFNADFVRTLVKEPPENFPESAVSALNGLVTLNELTLLCSGLFLLLIIAIAFYTLSRNQTALLLCVISSTALIVFSGWLLLKADKEALSREAIIVSGPADVRNGPGEENSVGFTLPEGRKVMILGAKDSWTAIGLKTEGLKGWLENKYLEEI